MMIPSTKQHYGSGLERIVGERKGVHDRGNHPDRKNERHGITCIADFTLIILEKFAKLKKEYEEKMTYAYTYFGVWGKKY